MDNQSADLSGILGKLLENPDTLKSAMEIASKLKNSGAFDGFAVENKTEEYEQKGGAYSEEARKALPENEESVQTMSGGKGERANRRQLLNALRPYMNKDRQEKIDAILKVLKLLDLAEQFGVLGKQI